MRLVLLLSVIAIAAFAQSQPPSPAPPKDADIKEAHRQTSEQAKIAEGVGSPAGEQSDRAGNQDRPAPQQDHSNTVIAVFTGVLAVVAVFQFFISWQQAKYIANAERAWIMVDLVQNDAYSSAGYTAGSTYVDVVLYCQNSGNTPAWIDEVKASVAIIPRDALPPDWSRADRKFVGPMPLAVGEKSRPIPLTLDVKGTPSLGEHVVIYGVVRYRHPFGRGVRTTFAYWSVQGHPWERLYGSIYHNHNT